MEVDCVDMLVFGVLGEATRIAGGYFGSRSGKRVDESRATGAGPLGEEVEDRGCRFGWFGRWWWCCLRDRGGVLARAGKVRFADQAVQRQCKGSAKHAMSCLAPHASIADFALYHHLHSIS